jgi:hypothetical protein
LRPGETTLPSPFVAPPPKMDDLVSVAPPPKLEEMPVRMVPSESVRFAQAREEPQPERAVSVPPTIEEPDDGVPVRINEDGSITELPDDEHLRNQAMAQSLDEPVISLEALDKEMEKAKDIPSTVSFRNDGPPREPDATDPTVDYVRVGNEWVPKTKLEAASTQDEQSSYEEAERGNNPK